MDRIGRYKIVRELGRGAMGVVYHAIDPNIGRPVAIKTIHFGGTRKPEEEDRQRERLFREARSAGMLSHPGIVTIYDVEQQGELAYIAMEYVDGPTLDHLLNEPLPLAAERMFSILAQTGVALIDAASMAEAVAQANGKAHAGDAVLMSPACASFDMFDNYEHRARMFCEAVNQIASDAGAELGGTL